jgi:hypothetical protein
VAHWSSAEQTVYYGKNTAELLHELGHALLDHKDFIQDIELLHIERDAWEKARQLAPQYKVKIDDDLIETALDGYRDWLHARSLCPRCHQTGLQDSQTLDYYCVNCNARWQVNDARSCGLKRRMINQQASELF